MSDNTIRFSTKYYDTETGLVYYGYRYYWPAMGRWICRDPIGEKILRKTKAQINTIYLNNIIKGDNNYIYVKNNPINKIDPFGLFEMEGYCYLTCGTLGFFIQGGHCALNCQVWTPSATDCDECDKGWLATGSVGASFWTAGIGVTVIGGVSATGFSVTCQVPGKCAKYGCKSFAHPHNNASLITGGTTIGGGYSSTEIKLGSVKCSSSGLTLGLDIGLDSSFSGNSFIESCATWKQSDY